MNQEIFVSVDDVFAYFVGSKGQLGLFPKFMNMLTIFIQILNLQLKQMTVNTTYDSFEIIMVTDLNTYFFLLFKTKRSLLSKYPIE